MNPRIPPSAGDPPAVPDRLPDLSTTHALRRFELPLHLEWSRPRRAVDDQGLDLAVLLDMLATLDRYTDEELADLGAAPKQLRTFTEHWREHLREAMEGA